MRDILDYHFGHFVAAEFCANHHVLPCKRNYMTNKSGRNAGIQTQIIVLSVPSVSDAWATECKKPFLLLSEQQLWQKWKQRLQLFIPSVVSPSTDTHSLDSSPAKHTGNLMTRSQSFVKARRRQDKKPKQKTGFPSSSGICLDKVFCTSAFRV